MKKLYLIFLIPIIGISIILCSSKSHVNFQEGDIVFTTDNSSQGKAVKLATNSKYSHVGVVLKHNGELYLYEAVQPVRKVKLDYWMKRGGNTSYAVKRFSGDTLLTKENFTKMKLYAEKNLGKDYDPYFGWKDDILYCSEYVWKIYYEGTGLKLSDPKKLKEYNTDHPYVQQIMKQRYGNNIPYDEKMVSPGDLFESELLKCIHFCK